MDKVPKKKSSTKMKNTDMLFDSIQRKRNGMVKDSKSKDIKNLLGQINPQIIKEI